MRNVLRRIGVDRAILLTVLGRGWSLVAGLLTVGFVTHFMSPVGQGYYYTFYSLIALQVFVEMGLTFVVVQLASHEVAYLTWSEQGTLQGDAAAKGRLQSLFKFALTWFGSAAVVAVAILSTAGLHFFTARADTSSTEAVTLPWILLVVFAAANLIVTAVVALIEGCGRVIDVAGLRLLQSILTVLPLWLVMSLGGGLFALGASSFTMCAVGVGWLAVKYRRFLIDLWRYRTNSVGISWRHEIWPFQWRIALSWASGYLSFQFVTPLLFSSQGPVAAGQMGMSLQIISAMNGAVMVWISTKTPFFGQLIARREFAQLDQSFNRALSQSLILLVCCVVIGLFLLWQLQSSGVTQAQRILPWYLMAGLCLGAVANHISGAQGAYLRSFKKDPFMPLSLLSGGSTVLLMLWLIPAHGMSGAVLSYVTVAICVGLIGGSIVFWKKRIEYAHAK